MSVRRRLAVLVRGPKVALVLRWTVGLGLVAALLLYFDVSAILSELRGVAWPLALPAIIGLTAMHLVGALTWRMVSARFSGIRFDWPYAVRAYYVAQAAGSLTPSNIGSDIYRTYALTGNARRWETALAPIILQRAASYVALLLLGVAASFLVPFSTNSARLAALFAGFLFTAVAVLLAFAWAATNPDSVPARLARRLRLPLAWLDGPVRSRLWTASSVALLLALVFHGGSITVHYVLVVAVYGEGVALVPTLATLMIARLAILLPISISGLGFQEGALALLFPLVGLTAETALAVSLLSRLGLLLTILVGGLFLSTSRVHPGETERRPESSEDEWER